MRFEDAIGPLLLREGGYVNHRDDRGGETKYGITQAVYHRWNAAHKQPLKSVAELQPDEAKTIYKALYWTTSRCEQLPDAVREIHFDSAVNHGVRRAAQLLQSAVKVEQDGIIGPMTLKAVHDMGGELVKARYIAARYRFFGSIVQRDRSQLVFMAGWMARMEHFS